MNKNAKQSCNEVRSTIKALERNKPSGDYATGTTSKTPKMKGGATAYKMSK